MQYKNIALIAMGLLASATVFADPIDQNTARNTAANFLMQRGRSLSAQQPSARAPRKTLTSSLNNKQADAAYYVFNADDNNGFVIVSGDDRTEAILGYAEQGKFNSDNLPCNVKQWLDSYAEQISLLESSTTQSVAITRATTTYAAIEPLIQTAWDQGSPYNDKCPTINGAQTYTGCVATATAQIMYFHQHPTGTVDAIDSYTYEDSDENEITISALPATTFRWDEMQLTYDDNTTTGREAVAELMRYVGQAEEMEYSTSASGTSDGAAVEAFTQNFGYSPTVSTVMRDNYSIAAWDSLIYSELAASRPVIYNGQSSGGGHSFICDGYDGNGLFHINWGWSGHYNGYFRLSVLSPDGSGIGGSASSDGYNMSQTAIINIKPREEGEPDVVGRLLAYGFETASGRITCYMRNNTSVAATFDYGYVLVQNGDTLTERLFSNTSYTELRPGYAISFAVNLAFRANVLTEGTHILLPVSRVRGTEQWYSAVPEGAYIEVTNSGNVFTARYVPGIGDKPENGTLECTEDPVALGNLVMGDNQAFNITLTAHDSEYNGSIYLLAGTRSGNVGSARSYTTVAVPQDGEVTTTLSFTPENYGTFYMTIAYDQSGANIIKQWTIYINREDTTGINTLDADKQDTTDDWYTLSGQRVTAPAKGVYINNGKKVVVK